MPGVAMLMLRPSRTDGARKVPCEDASPGPGAAQTAGTPCAELQLRATGGGQSMEPRRVRRASEKSESPTESPSADKTRAEVEAASNTVPRTRAERNVSGDAGA